MSLEWVLTYNSNGTPKTIKVPYTGSLLVSALREKRISLEELKAMVLEDPSLIDAAIIARMGGLRRLTPEHYRSFYKVIFNLLQKDSLTSIENDALLRYCCNPRIPIDLHASILLIKLEEVKNGKDISDYERLYFQSFYFERKDYDESFSVKILKAAVEINQDSEFWSNRAVDFIINGSFFVWRKNDLEACSNYMFALERVRDFNYLPPDIKNVAISNPEIKQMLTPYLLHKTDVVRKFATSLLKKVV